MTSSIAPSVFHIFITTYLGNGTALLHVLLAMCYFLLFSYNAFNLGWTIHMPMGKNQIKKNGPEKS